MAEGATIGRFSEELRAYDLALEQVGNRRFKLWDIKGGKACYIVVAIMADGLKVFDVSEQFSQQFRARNYGKTLKRIILDCYWKSLQAGGAA
jgi:hypothetical protein